MADLEDGELPSDDDSEVVQPSKQESAVIGEKPVHVEIGDVNIGRTSFPIAGTTTTARHVVPGLSSSDESSDDSDDGGRRWASKAKKKRVESMEMETARQSQAAPLHRGSAASRRVNNVWGAVLQEQTLSHTMVGLGVDKLDGALQMDRDVESYDFTQAKLDSRPHKALVVDPQLEVESHDPFDSVIGHEQFGQKRGTKRRRPVKDRIGKKKSKEVEIHISKIEPKLEDNEAKIVSDIVTDLDEPNVELIGRVVRVLGKDKALELLKQTQEKEADGGILTFNKERRRTPGGVYIFLLKTDPDVKKEQVRSIFLEEMTRNKKLYRANQKKKLKRIREAKRGKSFDISDDIKECLEKKAEEIRQAMEEAGPGDDMDHSEIPADPEIKHDPDPEIKPDLEIKPDPEMKLVPEIKCDPEIKLELEDMQSV